jgi:hypothetical protein
MQLLLEYLSAYSALSDFRLPKVTGYCALAENGELSLVLVCLATVVNNRYRELMDLLEFLLPLRDKKW